MLKYINCNLCGSNETIILIPIGLANIVQCKKCGMVYENPRVSENDLLKNFTSDEVIVRHKKTVWYEAKIKIFTNNLKRIEKYLPNKGRLLDIGCGYGTFLKIAKESGWDVHGVDISESAYKHAKENFGLNVFKGTLKEVCFPDDYFDVITLWDVLDLLSDPFSELVEINRILKKGGLILFRVRNVTFHLNVYLLFGYLAKKLRIKPTLLHLYGFSDKTAKRMLGKVGFKNVKIINSELTTGDPYSTGEMFSQFGMIIIKKIVFSLSWFIFYLTGGRLVLAPSILAFARKSSVGTGCDLAVTYNKIKVLHIITRLDKGGSAHNTLLTVSRLDKEKFDVTLISGYTNDSDGEIADFISTQKLNYVCICDLVRQINPLKDIKTFWKIFKFIKKKNFDIIHTHSSKAGIIGRWAGKLAGVKIIVHSPHGHIFYGYFGWFKNNLFIFLEKLTGLITDRIITLTQKGKEEHIKYKIAPTDKFIPIYSGIEIDKFSNFQVNTVEEKEKLNISLDAPVIGTVSRLAPVKGTQYFIASLSEVVKFFPTIKIIIVGDGSEKEKLKHYATELGLSENVVFLGLCKDVRRIVSTFDIFVLPSLNEGMGRCLLEAQALGIPVVATKVGGIPEVVRDGLTGILVSPRNPKEMAETIISLLRNKSARKDMSEAAKKWIGERFGVEAMVEKISDLYQELLKEK